jgi:hypothetical protein
MAISGTHVLRRSRIIDLGIIAIFKSLRQSIGKETLARIRSHACTQPLIRPFRLPFSIV